MNIKEHIKRLSGKYSSEIIALRRKIHQNPELAFEEHETSKLIFSNLKKLKIDNVKKIAVTGVIGLIQGRQNGKCAALRADIDALPIYEKTGLPFASKKPGKCMLRTRCSLSTAVRCSNDLM
jgi:metal-dependent amidase/aminoacylase/carboxypeptidase family protein